MHHERPTNLKILDLAAGSGEATEVFHLWKTSRWPPPPPPSPFPSRAVSRPSPSLPPKEIIQEPTMEITATDPFTSPAYLARTTLPCLSLSFSDVASGLLPTLHPLSTDDTSGLEEYHEEDLYDIVIVSFALHLVESSSELWSLLRELSKRCKWLIVCAPHKKPDVRPFPSFLSLLRGTEPGV